MNGCALLQSKNKASDIGTQSINCRIIYFSTNENGTANQTAQLQIKVITIVVTIRICVCVCVCHIHNYLVQFSVLFCANKSGTTVEIVFMVGSNVNNQNDSHRIESKWNGFEKWIHAQYQCSYKNDTIFARTEANWHLRANPRTKKIDRQTQNMDWIRMWIHRYYFFIFAFP